MKNNSLLIGLFLLSLIFNRTVHAAGSENLIAEIIFYRDYNKLVTHKYSLIEKFSKSSKSEYLLILKLENDQIKTKTLSEGQAQELENRLTRMIWQMEYRKPSSMKRCIPYAKLSSGEDQTTICSEDSVRSFKSLWSFE